MLLSAIASGKVSFAQSLQSGFCAENLSQIAIST